MIEQLKQKIIDNGLEISEENKLEFIQWLIDEWDFDCYNCKNTIDLSDTVEDLESDLYNLENEIYNIKEKILDIIDDNEISMPEQLSKIRQTVE